MAFDLTPEEAIAFCKEVARAVDRIADGQTETICLELCGVNEAGEHLVFMATIDPELWPRIRSAVQAHLSNKRDRQRIAQHFKHTGGLLPRPQDEEEEPTT